MTGHHDKCNASYRPFYFEVQKKKWVMVFKEDIVYCECHCHNPDGPVKKPRARRRKS